MAIIANIGARRVCGLSRGFNVHDRLVSIKQAFSIDAEAFHVQVVVSWLGHCFRHPDHPISLLLSLPLDGRLTTLRSRGAETPLSNFALSSWLSFLDVGLDGDFPSSGRPGVRGASG